MTQVTGGTVGFAERVARVRVRCPDLDTVFISHPSPAVDGYPRVSTEGPQRAPKLSLYLFLLFIYTN